MEDDKLPISHYVIEKDDIEVLLHRDDDDPSVDVAVRLTHKSTGITAESWDGTSQQANYELALAQLERRVAAAGQSPSVLGRLRRWLG